MGSFANGLHVKCDDSRRVAAGIESILGQLGWQPTAKAPGRAAWPGPATLRGVRVSAPLNSWVSILDTDLLGAHTLAGALAKDLETHAIFCMVNDSDSWCYLLAEPTGEVSEFDSVGETDEDVSEEDLAQLQEKVAALQGMMSDGSWQQRIQQMHVEMMADAPAEIREIEASMRSGKVTPAQMQQYQAWAIQQMPKFMGQLGGFMEAFKQPVRPAAKKNPKRRSKAERAAQRKRLEQLRPLLAEDATDEQVQEVFEKQAAFAEDVLAEFLRLLGIPDYYANLSYRYLEETRDDELNARHIQFVHHFRFEKS
jgi:hypothetical protein